MEKCRVLSTGFGVVLIVAMACMLWLPHAAEAKNECYLVTIHNTESVQLLSPVIHMYDCVVWMNWTREAPKIVFTKASMCAIAIKARTGFRREKTSDCFATQPLGFGQVAALTFSEPGVFNYSIEFKNGRKLSGKVKVE